MEVRNYQKLLFLLKWRWKRTAFINTPISPPQAREKETLISRKRKMGGGMETNKNRWIEDWATNRENLEHHFRWTRRNLALVGIFGVAVPVLVYKGIIKEFNMQDDDAGRPHRKWWFT